MGFFNKLKQLTKEAIEESNAQIAEEKRREEEFNKPENVQRRLELRKLAKEGMVKAPRIVNEHYYDDDEY